jgi:predicted DNA binding protein
MATVAEIDLPAEEFALHETLARVAGIEVEIERLVVHSGDRVVPFVRVSAAGSDEEEIQAALDADSSVAALTRLAALDNEWLYQVEWVKSVRALVRMVTGENGTILTAVAQNGTWNLRMLFPEREALARTYEYCTDMGLTFDVKRLYRLEDGRHGRFGLTDKQHDTVALAFKHGYYEIPRATAAQGLAEELGISHQALSEQLRRAHENLVENTIALGDGVDRERGIGGRSQRV